MKTKKNETKAEAKPAEKPALKKHYDVIRPKQVKKRPELAQVPSIVTKTHVKGDAAKVFRKLFGSVVFGRLYAVIAVILLALTTLLWTVLSARLQGSNADQLVDPYLFQNNATLHGATFPGAHSFLLKWPLFWLVRVFGETDMAYIGMTIAVVAITVAFLAFVLAKIERRPAVFGTLCMALASVLLLVPAQPYAGGILPVNMAMLATRNLEYVLFIASLVFIVRAPRVRSRQFYLAIAALVILIASDKLFLALSIGAALSMLFIYALRQRTVLVSLAARWLLVSMLAAVGGVGLLALINASGATNIAGDSTSSPYSISGSSRDVGLGAIYGGLDILTNFGANPAYDATEVKNVPHNAVHRLKTLSGVTYIINALILLTGLVASWKLIWVSFLKPKRQDKKHDTAASLAVALLFISVAALLVFIATNHYYAVDSRYLTICVFAIFIATATYARQHSWRRNHLVIGGVVIMAGIFLSVPAVINTYADQRSALDDITQRNASIVQAVAQHKVMTLVGDYWRVIPAKQASHGAINVFPLANCTQPRDVLASSAWQTNLHQSSFAYILTVNGSLTDFPSCTLDQVTAVFGHPDASQLIAGTYAKPQELLLFYDHGIHKSVADSKVPGVTATVAPITPEQLPNVGCTGPTVMTIVAHQDDDLLFTSPDLLHEVKAGYCMRTVYMTAGDAGHGQFYWLSREQGSEAAYDQMDGPDKDVWVQRTVSLNAHEFVTVASPRSNPKVSLIFMHLPDGNIDGSGFKQSGFESLQSLHEGRTPQINTVDGQSTYDSSQLTAALVELMQIYKPSEIHTQSPTNKSDIYPDHSDHLTVGKYVQAAYPQYEQQQYADQVTIPIKYYIGYPTHQMPPNVSSEDLQQKQAAFFAYGKYDGSVCNNARQCSQVPTYNSYLSRQYELEATP